MIPMMTQPQEGPQPIYQTPPPNTQPIDLEMALQVVDSIIWADGFVDSNEQRVFMGWVMMETQKMRAAAAQAAAQGVAAGPAAAQQQGLGTSSVGNDTGSGVGPTQDYNPFGGVQGGLGDSDESAYAA